MTREQKRERDFWLGCARCADARHTTDEAGYNLCDHIQIKDTARWSASDLFRPDTEPAFWWDYVTDKGKLFEGEDVASGRVLAACFLAAMAESGDL